MTTYVTGRTLDEAGDPIPGTGFEVIEGSWLDDRIRGRTGPVTSHPTRSVWGIPLSGDEGPIRTLSVFGAGYDGPPAHYHERSVELFEIESGSLTMTLDGAAASALVPVARAAGYQGAYATYLQPASNRRGLARHISPSRVSAVDSLAGVPTTCIVCQSHSFEKPLKTIVRRLLSRTWSTSESASRMVQSSSSGRSVNSNATSNTKPKNTASTWMM
jgi:hypothetical protein